MSKIVKHTPIRKNNKTYQVGETFPYSDKDKSLLTKGYLKVVEEAKDEQQVAKKKPKAIERKRNAVKKRPKVKRKNNLKSDNLKSEI